MASKYYVTHTVCLDGASSGSISYSKVKHLARHGAKVYMGARSRSNVAEGRRSPGSDEVVWLEMDSKDPRSSKKAAEKFIKREKKLDILSLHIFVCLHDVGTLS